VALIVRLGALMGAECNRRVLTLFADTIEEENMIFVRGGSQADYKGVRDGQCLPEA
jgi:hypothetical protein